MTYDMINLSNFGLKTLAHIVIKYDKLRPKNINKKANKKLI